MRFRARARAVAQMEGPHGHQLAIRSPSQRAIPARDSDGGPSESDESNSSNVVLDAAAAAAAADAADDELPLLLLSCR